MIDARWALTDKGEIFLTSSLAQTEAAFDPLQMQFSSDVPIQLFPDGLPGPGPDPTSPVGVHDFDFTSVDDYSDLDYVEIRSSLGFRYQVRKNLGVFAAVSRYDLEDDEPFLGNTLGLPQADASGAVNLVSGGLHWSF